MNFVELSREEFRKIQNNFSNSSFYQSVEWASIKELNNWKVNYVGVKRNNKIIAASLLLSRNLVYKEKLFYAPRGFLIDYNDLELLDFFIDNVKKYIKSNKGFVLKIDPLVEYVHHDNCGNVIDDNFNNKDLVKYLKGRGFSHFGFSKGYTKEAQFRWSYCLDIKGNYDSIYENMNQRCRRCLRKADRYPLVSKNVNKNNIDDFMGIMEHTAKRQNHGERSKDYYLSIISTFKRKSVFKIIYLNRNKFLKNFKDDKLYDLIKNEKRNLIPISAGGFIFDKDRLNYVYGGTYSYYMSLMAQYKLQMDMIMLAKEKGMSTYDFGGITGDFNPKSRNYGVYEFKRGFGGRVVEYIGEFDLVTYKALYGIYNEVYDKYRLSKQIINNNLFKVSNK